MPAGGLITAGVGAAIGAGEAIWGNSEKQKYQDQLNALALQRPKYNINPEEYDNLNLAQSQANMGIGAGARQQLQNNADRTLGSLTSAALMGGADANGLANIADKAGNAYNQNAIYDDQVRLQNLQRLQSAYTRMSANKDKVWQINDYQPWKDKMTGLSQQVSGANNMFMQGLGMAGSGLQSFGQKGGFGKIASGVGGLFGGGNGDGQGVGGTYTPADAVMLGQGMDNTVSPEYPTNHPMVQLLGNNTNTWG